MNKLGERDLESLSERDRKFGDYDKKTRLIIKFTNSLHFLKFPIWPTIG